MRYLGRPLRQKRVRHRPWRDHGPTLGSPLTSQRAVRPGTHRRPVRSLFASAVPHIDVAAVEHCFESPRSSAANGVSKSLKSIFPLTEAQSAILVRAGIILSEHPLRRSKYEKLKLCGVNMKRAPNSILDVAPCTQTLVVRNDIMFRYRKPK